jgi:small subunit ribosomal protein S2
LPIIGIVDTNYNPEGIDYVVPGNDDSIRAVSFYAREIANAVLEAKASAPIKATAKKAVSIKKAVAKEPIAKEPEKLTALIESSLPGTT